MIPLRDENPSRSVPVITVFLILVNISVFVYLHYFFHGPPDAAYRRLGFVPHEFFRFAGADPNRWMPPFLTLFSAMFLHGGWLHLLGNMLYLWIFGDNVEDTLGHGRYLFFYLLCGVIAGLTHGVIHMDSEVPAVGASGAIAGVLGAYMVLFPRARVRTLLIIVIIVRIVRIPAILLLGFWIVIQIYSGMWVAGSRVGTGIAWFAHIGGFAAGAVLTVMMKKRRHRAKR